MFEIITIIILALIIAGLLLERFFMVRHFTTVLERNNKAIMSRNVTEYTQAVKTDEADPRESVEQDEVLETDLSDDEFYKNIKTQHD